MKILMQRWGISKQEISEKEFGMGVNVGFAGDASQQFISVEMEVTGC